MNSPITLQSAATIFSHWRATRKSSNETIPLALRAHAIDLLTRYQKSEVISALKINHSTLKRWQQNNQDDAPSFVPLISEPHEAFGLSSSSVMPPENISSGIKITLCNAVGIEMSIAGDITPTLLHGITSAFIDSHGEKS